MKKYLILLSIPIIFLAGCSTGGKLTKLTEEGTVAYNNGDYQGALNAWEQVISDYEAQDKAAECPWYGNAGLAAFNLQDYDKGKQYIELAIYYNTASPDEIFTLAKEYERIDNLSKELDALEAFKERFPENEQISSVKSRLFQLYTESENWQQAVDTWPGIQKSDKAMVPFMEGYFTANKKLNNTEVCDELAERILTAQPENIPALEFKGRKYYNLAENRYQEEMEAYEKNKTNKQYNILIKAFEQVTKDFKTSLGYFLQLYEIDPSPKYAKFLANIYTRLDDKQKAEYYKSKSE